MRFALFKSCLSEAVSYIIERPSTLVKSRSLADRPKSIFHKNTRCAGILLSISMETFQNLETALTTFEIAQFKAINSQPAVWHSLPSEAIHGGIQSVAIDNSSEGVGHPLPVVAAVGINYHQSHSAITWPPFTNYLGVTSTGAPQIIDAGLSGMRSATDFALAAYHRNGPIWVAESMAAPGIQSTKQYQLIATNLSPFITLKAWSKLSTMNQATTLSAWPWQNQLDAFYSAFSPVVDLWIGHGTSQVRPNFLKWRRHHNIARWMVTYNLSRLGLLSMNNAKKSAHHGNHLFYR